MALGAAATAALIGLNAATLPAAALGKGLAVTMGLAGGAATFLTVLLLPVLVPLSLISGALYLRGGTRAAEAKGSVPSGAH